MYRLRESGEVKTKPELILDNANTSLPKVWTQATLDALGVDVLLEEAQPTPSVTQIVVSADPVQDENGDWHQAWALVDKYADEFDENGDIVKTKEQFELEALAEELDSKKRVKLEELNDYYQELKSSPTADSGLGFRVDSGYDNLRDFEVVHALVLEYINDPVAFNANKTQDEKNVIAGLVAEPGSGFYVVTVRDADNEYQTVTPEQMADVIQSIKNYGFRVKTSKWQMEETIKAATAENIDALDVTDGWP